MSRTRAIVVGFSLLLASGQLVAQQTRVTMEGRATVLVRGPEGNAVASWDYSRTNHNGPWLLIELAIQAKKRVAVDRNQITLLTPKEEEYFSHGGILHYVLRQLAAGKAA